MAKENKRAPDKPKVAAPGPEAVYSRNELIGAAASFGVKPEVVTGALKLAGRDEMTRAEIEAAIKRFLERKM